MTTRCALYMSASHVTSLNTLFTESDKHVQQRLPHATSSLPKISPYSPRNMCMAFGPRKAKVLG